MNKLRSNFLQLSYLIFILAGLIGEIRADNESDLIDLLSNLIKNEKSINYYDIPRERLVHKPINDYTRFGMFVKSPENAYENNFSSNPYFTYSGRFKMLNFFFAS